MDKKTSLPETNWAASVVILIGGATYADIHPGTLSAGLMRGWTQEGSWRQLVDFRGEVATRLFGLWSGTRVLLNSLLD